MSKWYTISDNSWP